MNIYALTTTAERPIALSLCKEQIESMQTAIYPTPIHHLIINEAQYTEFLLRRKKVPTYNSQRDLLRRGIAALNSMLHIKGDDLIFIIEDDDFYHPYYIRNLSALAEEFDVIGLTNAIYYHLPSRTYANMCNTTHASLCNTAFKYKHIDIFERAVESGEKFIDIEFWKLVDKLQLNKILVDFKNYKLSVGIKGLPGIRGIGSGHDEEFRKDWASDPELKVLVELVTPWMFGIYKKYTNETKEIK